MKGVADKKPAKSAQQPSMDKTGRMGLEHLKDQHREVEIKVIRDADHDGKKS